MELDKFSSCMLKEHRRIRGGEEEFLDFEKFRNMLKVDSGVNLQPVQHQRANFTFSPLSV